MRIKYNAPTILTYALFCVIVMGLTIALFPSLTINWFAAPGRGQFSPTSVQSWVSLLSHVAGHYDWNHLFANFAIILLVGPMLEESYGSLVMLFMILATAAITGVLNMFFFSTMLMGASGVVFMLILLASFTNFSQGEIPITFILILVMYLGTQLFMSFGPSDSNISHFAHIVGGFCGSLFGFFFTPKRYARS